MMPKSCKIGDFVMWGYHFGQLGLLGQLGRLGCAEQKMRFFKILGLR